MKSLFKSLLGLVLAVLVSNSIYAQEIYTKKNVNLLAKTKSLKDSPKKVYIKNFKVFYQMIAEAEKTTYGGRQLGGGSYTGNATARMAVGVQGVNSEDLQNMTNDLFKHYVSRLEALGYEVLNSKDLNIEFFEGWELLEGPRINESQIKGSLMVVPEGYSYYVKGVKKSGKEKTGAFMSGVTGQAENWGSAIYGPLPKITQELNDALVIEVALNVGSIYLDPKSVLGTAKVKGGAYLRLQNARVSYISGRMKGPGVANPENYLELTVSKPVRIPGVFGEQNFKAVAVKQRTTVPDYATFFTVENTEMNLTNFIECESEDFVREVNKTNQAFLDLSLDKLDLALKGEKVKKME